MSREPLADPSAVLFDMDGTLFQSESLWDISLSELATALGGTLTPETRQRVVGRNLIDTVRLIHDDLHASASVEHSAALLLDRTRELFEQGAPWRSGARELVISVRERDLPTALVTSSYRKLTTALLAKVEPGLFSTVVCGDEVARPKPDPESYVTAAAQLGVDPKDCIAIEDSPTGVAAAVAAGCTVVAVPLDTCDPIRVPGSIVTDLETLTYERLLSITHGSVEP